MKKYMKKEQGSLVIEAAFVYPIMFFVIIFLIYMGNMFYLKSRVESCVNAVAIKGAAYFADPLLEVIETSGVPDGEHVSLQPYRYLNVFNNGNDISDGEAEIREGINTAGFFAGMTPRVVSVTPEIHNYVIYQTYEVNVEYVLEFPIKFIFQDEKYALDCTAHAEIPVVDSGEFLRNTDMAIDFIQRSETGQKALDGLTGAVEKLGEFINPSEGEGD